MRSPSPEMDSSTVPGSANVTPRGEKCSRNKRKFRQDPPFPNQVSGDESLSGGNITSAAVPSEGENSWLPEPRSAESTSVKNTCSANSSSKECDSGISSAPCKSDAAKFYQEHLKLMRWFRSGQGKGLAAGGAVTEGKNEQGYKTSEACEEEEDDIYELEEVDWDDCTEGELEELLVKNLDSLYKEAISKIVSRGHDAEEALKAVLNQGRCYGAKDAVSNIVESALAFLIGNKDGGEQSFADLKELQKYGLTEMVGLLREVRPSLSKGDAMWCLLMCDMNFALACVMEDANHSPVSKEFPVTGPPNNSAKSKPTPCSAAPQPPPDSPLPTAANSNSSNPQSAPNSPVASPPSAATVTNSEPPLNSSPPSPPPPISNHSSVATASISFPPPPCEVNAASPVPDISSNCEVELSSVESLQTITQSSAVATSVLKVLKEQVVGLANCVPIAVVESLNSLAQVGCDHEVDDGESGRKVNNHSNPANSIGEVSPDSSPDAEHPPALPEELPNLAAAHEALSSEEPGCTTTASPVLVIERHDACETQAIGDPLGSLNLPDTSSKLIKSDLVSNPLSESNSSEAECSITSVELQASVGSPLGTVERQTNSGSSNTDDVVPRVPDCSSEAADSSTADCAVVMGETVQAAKTLTVVPETLLGCKENSVSGRGEEGDVVDEMLAKVIQRNRELEASCREFASRVRELETKLQKSSEWAKQKVMQAARRLTKDLQELKALRLEREEGLRFRKDRQASEDSTLKKLTESDAALRKATAQADRANAALRKLESENAEIRAEMLAAKLSAAESMASYQEIAKRERKAAKRAQAWEKQKAKFQEEVSDEKKKVTQLQQQLALAKERQQQAEVRWRQEEKAKEESNLQKDHERRAREQSEIAAKRREESLRRKAETNYQRHREDIQRLESEILQLRTTAEAAQLATSRWGPGVAVTPHIMELGNLHALKEHNIRLSREIAELQDLSRRDVRRERECVMCMCEEMSVVFLPCAHQVVCVKCNDLHEKQGMRDCPSCRTHIQQRIRVFGVSS